MKPSRIVRLSFAMLGMASILLTAHLAGPRPTRAASESHAPTGARLGLRNPNGVAVGPNGDVYVADSGHDQIVKVSATGRLLQAWGVHGSLPGQFFYPEGIAVGGNGNAYVADSGNYRIQKFSATGRPLAQWGHPAPLTGPRFLTEHLAVNIRGDVYVTDSVQGRILEISPAGRLLRHWNAKGLIPFPTRNAIGSPAGPAGIAIDRQDDLYVGYGSYIQKFSPAGQPLALWKMQPYITIQAVAVAPDGSVYASDINHQQILKFSSTGSLLAKWGGLGARPGKFDNPVALAFDARGNLYVADQSNSRIQIFSTAGAVLRAWR